MKSLQAFWFILLLNIGEMTMGEILKSTNSLDKESENTIFYPKSTVDLIVKFFQTYKHIKRLTLFLCDNSSMDLSISIPIQFDYNRNTSSTKVEQNMQNDNPKSEQEHQLHRDGCLNFQQIVKYLMASGNFLIKGDGNIDATMFTTSGNASACILDTEYEKLNSVYAYSWWNMLKSDDFKQGVVLDLRCRHSQFILQQASECGFFNTSYHWMILEQPSTMVLKPLTIPPSPPPTSAKLFSFGVEFFERLNINMNSEITLVKPQQSNSGTNSTPEWNIYDLYDVWNTGKLYGGKLNVSHMGIYSADAQFLNISFKETTIIRRLNVHGIKLRIMIVVTQKFYESLDQYLDHNHDSHLDSMHRSNYHLLTYVRDMFNFSWIMYRTNSWGYSKNGTFDGMIGALVRKEIDVGGSPAFFRLERAKVIDFTARTWISRNCFVFRHPTGTVRNLFLQPFNINVWYCIIVVGIFVIGTTSFITYREEKRSEVFSGSSHILTNRSGARKKKMKNVQSTMLASSSSSLLFNRSKKHENHRKLNQNDAAIAMQSQQQTRRRHQTSDSMLNTVQLKQHEAWMAKPEPNRHSLRWNQQQKPAQIIPQENVIIGICTKVFRKCFFSACRWLPVSMDQKMLPELKVVQPVNTNSHKKINHDNFRLNVYEYYSREKNEANTFGKAAVAAPDAMDRGDGTTMKNTITDANTKSTKAFDNVNFKYDESALSRCALLFIGSLCQQGSSETPQFTSRRCIIILILLFGFCTYQFYSASIVGSLLMEKPKTIKTLRNLIDSPLKLGIENIPYNVDFFKKTTDETAVELFEKKVKVVNPKTGDTSYNYMVVREGIDKVKQGGFAFHADTASFYKIITDEFSERSVCELSEMPLFPEQHMMSIVQKGSPLRKMMTYGLRRTFEHGLMYYERKRWHAQKPQCVRQMQPEDLMVSLDTTGSAFIALSFGISLSIFLLLIENAIWFYKKYKQMHTKTYLK